MKRYLQIAIFFFPLISAAQTDTLHKWTKSVTVDFSISGQNYGVNIVPGFSFENNRHHLSLGPVLLTGYRENEFTLTGLKFGYTFYPNPKQKTLDFFFTYDFLLQRITVIEDFAEFYRYILKENV